MLSSLSAWHRMSCALLLALTLMVAQCSTLVLAAPARALTSPTSLNANCGNGDQAANCGEAVSRHGGNVQHHVVVYLLFWGPAWQDQNGQNYGDYFNIFNTMASFFGSLAGTAYNNILHQYNDSSGPVYNDVRLGPISNPAPLFDSSNSQFLQYPHQLLVSDIQNEVAVAENNLGLSGSPDTQFIVFPQQGAQYTAGLNGVCGKHLGGAGGDTAFSFIRYASDLDGNPNNETCDYYVNSGDAYHLADSMTVTAAHEYAETATDPAGPLGGPCPPSCWGWTTTQPTGDPIEIGDQCQGYNGQYSASDLDQKLPSKAPYLWAQNQNACVAMSGQDYPSPDVTPPFHGVHTVQGRIHNEYSGSLITTLGEPLSEETPLAGGAVSYFAGQVCSGGYVIPSNNGYGGSGLTSGSAIFDTPSTGAHEVQGCIYHEYMAVKGGPGSSLGFPTSDECSVGNTGNRRSLFQHGTITWIRSTGQLVVLVSQHPPTVCGLNPHNDFNGDGLSDVVGLYNLGTLSNGNNATAAYEWLNTGSGLNPLDQVWSSVPNNFNWYGARWVSGDFNGDGQTDLVAAYNLGGSFAFYEWLGTSTGLNYLGPVYTSGSFDIYKAQFLAGDFNGDGKDDILAAYNLGSSISFYEWTSAGTSFKSLGAVYTSGSFDWTKAKWVSGDFNGDGKTDMAAAYNLGSSFAFYEWTSTGTGFKSLGAVYTSGSFTWAYAQFLAGDFNGDGKDDIVAAYDLGSSIGFYEWPSTGTGFKSLGAVYTSGSFDWFKAQFLTGDFNGDGKIDIMAMYNLGSTVGAYEWTSTGTGFNSLGDIYTTGTFDWSSCVWVP